MNKGIYRVVFNAAFGLWTVVQETASAIGKVRGPARPVRESATQSRVTRLDMLSMRHMAFAALCVLGMQPLLVDAQVVAAPASGSKPVVGVTANGLPIVQIATPNDAGVSNNSYTQYNVGSQGLLLNNSSDSVQTQLAGYVAGNPNLASDSARVIVNQVIGGSPSQLLGYTEVAGQRAEVVIANPAGIACNGCGFINTSRGVLTTGMPVFGGIGSLDAFHVTGGEIQIGSSGLNGSNVDQVDLIARSVAMNGKVWADRALNVVTGNNDVRHDDLSTQWLGPDGNNIGVSIDVSQLGGMYAGKIILIGTEKGVGVNSLGILAAQAGDIQLSSDGKVTLSGTTSASGNVSVSGAGEVVNAGSVYAKQNTALSSQGQVSNSGTVAALGNTTITGASVNSTGTLGAGIDSNGAVTGAGNLAVTSTGAVTAVGQQLVGGNLALSGSSLNMAGAQTSAKGNASLAAAGAGGDAGDIVLAGGALQASGSLIVSGTGTLTNDLGHVSAAQLAVTAGSVSNRGGRLTQTDTGTLSIQTGALDNSQGNIAANGAVSIASSSVNNTSGSITSSASLSVATTGHIDNSGGTLSGSTLTADAASLTNTHGSIDATTVAMTVPQFDNSNGKVTGNQLTVTAKNLTNAHGSLTQLGAGAMGLNVTDALDNSNGGLIQTHSTDLTLAPASLNNNGGTISHAGTGRLTLDANNGTGSLTNVGGSIVTTGQASVSVGSLDNTGGLINNVANSTGDVGISTNSLTAINGTINASRNLSVAADTVQGGGTFSAVNDLSLTLQGSYAATTNDRFSAGHNLSVTLPGAFSNAGTFTSVNGLAIHASDVTNSGTLSAGGLLSTQSNTLTNTGTIMGGSASLAATKTLHNLGPSALIGASDSAGKLELLAPEIENRDDTTATDAQATTTIHGLGQVVLAGGKDANGNYTKANRVRNQSGRIQSGGDMRIAANEVTNTRRTMTTTGFKSSVDPNLLERQGISLSRCTAIYMAACSGEDVAWVWAGDPKLIGGAFIEPPHGGQWNSSYQYTTYTGVAVANTIASISPQSQIVVGGKLNASSVGTFRNYWSQVAVTDDIASPGTLDEHSWKGQLAPQVKVTYSGEYHYNNYDNSEHDWRLPFGDAQFVGRNPGGYAQAAPADVRIYALPAYESKFTSGGTLSGTGMSINNTAGNASVTPLGLLPGQIDTRGPAQAGSESVHGGQLTSLSLSNFSNPTVARATAGDVLSHITVPAGGLFNVNAAPNPSYLIETNPAFANRQQWLSSNHYFEQLGMNPGQIQMRLGDGFYEQQLVQNQILSMTGKSVLTNYADTQETYRALMTSGAALAKSLELAPGMSLSPEQVSQLTSNVVIMQEQVVDGRAVLVPVVYLAQASQKDMGNGPVIAATNIDLQDATSVTNSGTISASNNFSMSAQTVDSSNGTLQAGKQMALVSSGDVNLTSATINAGNLALQAGEDLILDTAAKTVSQVSEGGATRVTTTLGPSANINVTGDAEISTGGNFEQNAASLNVGGALGMSIGGNWTLGVQQTGETKVVAGANGISNTHLVSDTGSSVTVGGKSSIAVEGDLTALGATFNLGGGGTIAAKGDVTLGAATATSTIESNSSGSDRRGSYAAAVKLSDDAVTGTSLTGGDSLAIVAGKDLNVIGSSVVLTQGTATLTASGDINVGAATETHVLDAQHQGRRRGLLSGKSKAGTNTTTTMRAIGSTISADAVNVTSGHDLNVQGSTIVGTNDVSLSAAHDVTITTSQDTMQSSSSHQERRSGLMTGGGIAVTIGSSKVAATGQQSSVSQNASTIGSLESNLTVQAGNTLHVTGSDLIAAQNVTGQAADIIIDSATDTANHSRTQQTSKSGLTIGLSGVLGDALNNTVSETQRARNDAGSQDRAAALHAIAAVGNVANVGLKATGQKKDDLTIGVQLSVGSSKSSNQSSESQTTQQGSSVKAGDTATFVAAGDGSASSGDVTVAGSNINASDVVLTANNQVNLVNTANTDSTLSSNSSSSASLGVSFGTGGWGVSASMQNAHGDGNSDAAIQNNTHVNATHSVTIVSGGETNLIGADVNANQVTANVGGNLNIVSVQDTTVSKANQSSAGAGVNFTLSGSAGASFSKQNGNGNANYAGVNEQAGINAGSGGFDITVSGNTGLTGAVISSAADASKNSLTTGTLTYSDIENHSHYIASSSGFSAGASIGAAQTAVGPSSVSGSGGVTPMMSQDASDDQNAMTLSAISAGTIRIMNPAAQTQDISSLSRDTANTHGSVTSTPDVLTILSEQADLMSATQAAGQAVARNIGEFANEKEQAAKDAGDSATAEAWAEGGTYRVLAHVAGGGLIGGLGGGGLGSALDGAAGAGVSATLGGKLNGLADSVGASTGSMTVGNTVSNLLAGFSGALVGGSTGAFMASNVDLYNRGGTNANGTGGTFSQLLDKAKAFGGGAYDWVVETYSDPVGDIKRWIGQGSRMAANDAHTIMSEPDSRQVYRGINIASSVFTPVEGGGPTAGPDLAPVGLGSGQQYAAGPNISLPPNAVASNSDNGNNESSLSQEVGETRGQASATDNTLAPGFNATESGIIGEAQSILNSPQLAEIQNAYSASQPVTVNVGGRIIQYEPNLPASGMTMFGENGFLIGKEAFSSSEEFQQTILHELYRLNTSASASGVSGSLATQETNAAASFAAKALGALKGPGK